MSSFTPYVSSAMKRVALLQDPAPTLIGERVNAQGSRKIKQLLLADDALAQLVREGGKKIRDIAQQRDIGIADRRHAGRADEGL